jgi:two-component system, NarL family, response regulator NreC
MPGSAPPALDTIEVVIADDHTVVRESLRLVLEAEADISVVGEAGELAETSRILRGIRPTVLLLDLLMRGESSLPALRGLLEASPSTAIVVLTMEAHPLVARDALRRGATGYVSKRAERAELVTAVRCGAARRTYLDPSIGAELAVQHVGEDEELTDRDVEILRLVALGHTNAEIAGQLYLSVRTVEAYRLEVQKRLALSSRADVVEYVRTRRLIGWGAPRDARVP